MSDRLKDLLARLLDKNPATRLTLPGLLTHPALVRGALRSLPSAAVHPFAQSPDQSVLLLKTADKVTTSCGYSTATSCRTCYPLPCSLLIGAQAAASEVFAGRTWGCVGVRGLVHSALYELRVGFRML